jgi:hypothetical protein
MRTTRTKKANIEPSFHTEQSTMVMKPNRRRGDEFDNRNGVETIILTVLVMGFPWGQYPNYPRPGAEIAQPRWSLQLVNFKNTAYFWAAWG